MTETKIEEKVNGLNIIADYIVARSHIILFEAMLWGYRQIL